MNALKSVLVPVDFSTESLAALQQAARLAGINGARLQVLHVVDDEALSMIAGSRHISFESESEIAVTGAREALARWVVNSIRDKHVNQVLLHGLEDCGYQGRIAVTASSESEAATLREKGAHLALTPFADASADAVRQILASSPGDLVPKPG